MKKYLFTSFKLTIVLILICSVMYPLLISAVARLAPGGGKGEVIMINSKVVGYANVGQKFTQDRYFWGRPSAVDYNAASSAGSNKGPSNKEYLSVVKERLDSFLAHNPNISKHEVPTEMVTASGSGLDPDISPASAYIQIKRIAGTRKMDEGKLRALVDEYTINGWLAPAKINVLKLNVALDKL